MNELMKTNVNLQVGKIELENKAQLSAMIDEALKKYENIVVTLETEKETKKQRAELNKVKQALEDFRIEKKKAYLEPLDAFEADVKDLVGKIDKVVSDIAGGLKELDEQQRAERSKRVDELVEEYGKGFEIVRKSSWLNKTAKEAHTVDDIKDQVREFEVQAKLREQSIETIRETCEINNLTPDGYIQLLESGAGDVLSIVKSINEAAQRKREEEAYNAEMERLKQEKEEAKPLPEPTKEEVIDVAKKVEPAPFETDELLTSVLELKGTLTQFQALNDALIKAGVQIRELSTAQDYQEKLSELNAYAS